MAETIIGHIKAFSSLNLPKRRAPLNAFLHLLAALTAYQFDPINPAASFSPLLIAASIKTRYRGKLTLSVFNKPHLSARLLVDSERHHLE